MKRLEGELALMSRRGETGSCAAARTDDTVKIDVVRHLVVGMVLQVKLDGIALPHPDEASRNRAAEGPECVPYSLGNLLFNLADLEFHDDFGRARTVSRRRHIGGLVRIVWTGGPTGGPRSSLGTARAAECAIPPPHSPTAAITATYTGFRLIINVLSVISLIPLAVRARPPQNRGIDADE